MYSLCRFVELFFGEICTFSLDYGAYCTVLLFGGHDVSLSSHTYFYYEYSRNITFKIQMFSTAKV